MTENPNTVKPPVSAFKKSVRKFLVYTLLILLLGGTIYYFICGMTYSDGTRSGVLTKVTRKGYIFKTFEGEMNIGGLNQGDGTIMPTSVFKFSVKERSVYNELEKAQGKKVVLHYKQVIHNFFWQGESDYFVFAMNPVQ